MKYFEFYRWCTGCNAKILTFVRRRLQLCFYDIAYCPTCDKETPQMILATGVEVPCERLRIR